MQFPDDVLRKCWFLAGPTASGKTALSLELASRLDAEILSLDSMAIYRGMDIGTAKPGREEQSVVPHHLIDVVDPSEEFSVADYVTSARDLSIAILARGKIPLFVGGTGLYLRAVLRGVFDGPPADWKLRHSLQEMAGTSGPDALHQRLAQCDPDAAQKLHPHDVRRVIRAIEVVEVSGRPLSAQQQQTVLPESSRPRHVYWLHPPRDWLHARIEERVDRMIAAGLKEEVIRLRNHPIPLGRTASQALGYREMIAHLQEGIPFETTIATIKTRTRQFAKRQHTWFRNLEECREIPLAPETSQNRIVDELLDSGSPSR